MPATPIADQLLAQHQLDFIRIPLSRRASPTLHASNRTAPNWQRTVVVMGQEEFSYELFMNVLFELYGKSNRIEVKQLGASNGQHRHKGRTPVSTVMVLLCLAGIAFNVRFAVALRQERRQSAKTQSRKHMTSTTNNHSTEPREKAFDLEGSIGWLDSDSRTQSQ